LHSIDIASAGPPKDDKHAIEMLHRNVTRTRKSNESRIVSSLLQHTLSLQRVYATETGGAPHTLSNGSGARLSPEEIS